MKLKKLLTISVSHNSESNKIRIDKNGFICLTDMVKFFPKKRLDKWIGLKSTNELVEFLITPNSGYLEPIKTKRGRRSSGTFACEDLAIDFAMWLCPVFKLKVIRAYREGNNFTEDWNRLRIASNLANRLQSEAIHQIKEDPKPHHHSNEARMINKLVFGRHEKGIRDNGTDKELELLNKLLSYNAALLEIGMDYKERKVILSDLSQPKAVNE